MSGSDLGAAMAPVPAKEGPAMGVDGVRGSGSFNIGRDCELAIIGPFGFIPWRANSVEIGRALSGDLLGNLLPGRGTPAGWILTVTLDRQGSEIDDLFCQIEENQASGC